MEQVTATWDDTTLYDSSKPAQPEVVAPDVDGSSTHDPADWSKSSPLKLKWKVKGSPGTDYGYSARCVDGLLAVPSRPLNVNLLLSYADPATQKFTALEAKYELTVYKVNPLLDPSPANRVTIANAPGPDASLFYLNAGHPAAYILNAAGEVKHVLRNTGSVLGLGLGADCPQPLQLPLASGDVVLLLTDGILAALSAAEEEFGPERTLAAVREHRHKPASAILDALSLAVREHTAGQPQQDYATAIFIKITAN